MPPRRTPSKPSSAGKPEADSRSPVACTPRRSTRSSRLRDNSVSQGNVSPTPDELGIGVGPCDVEQVNHNQEVTLNEIVVSDILPNSENEGVGPKGEPGAAGNLADSSWIRRRASRTPSSSHSDQSTSSPSRRGVAMKKQDFVVGIAANDDGKPDELSDVPTPKKRRVDDRPVRRIVVRRNRSKWDDPDEMLTNSDSPLVNAKLRELLCSAAAWDILTEEEKKEVLAKFPDDAEVLDAGTSNARPDVAALRNNNNFRHDVARYQEGLGKGFHDADWIQQAQAAHSSRQMGYYDEFLATDFEDKWGMPMLPQSEAGSEPNGSHAEEERTDGAPLDPVMLALSQDAAGQNAGADDMVKLQSAGVSHGDSSDINMEDRKDIPENTTTSEAAPARDVLGAGENNTSRPSRDDVNHDEQARMEGVAVQIPTELDNRPQEISDRGVEVPAASLVPDMMEGVELHDDSHKEQPENKPAENQPGDR
ncbi:putative proline-rich early nodulin protein [Rosellinia necatrix]|uniref:Putative proline-rich early nodulin protein n=1 Tax=Rosellinia necatrix TaxID=77044 RepID=A0A1W2TVQ4_ROSNE|nr:putative proline-rich early nodulin protein [Rosellinia necatrix]